MRLLLKKRSKKGLSHVDWAMGLAIFLLYLAWFFVFVKPHLAPSDNMNTLLDILDDGLRKNIFMDMNKMQIYVPDDVSQEYEPIIIPFTKDWTKISHTADYYVLDDGKMLFIGNTSQTKLFTIYSPHESLMMTAKQTIAADGERAQTRGFVADFDEYLISDVSYEGLNRIRDFNILLDDDEIDDEGEFENLEIAAKYSRSSEINHTTYVFARNPRLYSHIKANDHRNHTVTMSFVAHNYTKYYLNGAEKGDITYSNRENCKYYDTDSLDLYGNTGMAIIFEKDVSFKLCTNLTDLKVEITFPLEDDNYYIFMHPGDYNDIEEYPLDTKTGVVEKIRVISQKDMMAMKNREYSYQKEMFKYPSKRDFRVQITSEDVQASYGSEEAPKVDVYARKATGFMIDRQFEEKQANITMTVW